MDNDISIEDINIDKFKVRSTVEKDKFTIYLNKNISILLKMLKSQGRISSYSNCIEKALEEYMEIKIK